MTNEAPENQKPNAAEAMADKAKAAYQWWDHLATFHPEDPWWLGGLKLLIRGVGILILIILSPLLILGLIVAFLAVL